MREKQRQDIRQYEGYFNKIMDEVTVEAGEDEILYDPYIIDGLLGFNSQGFINTFREDSRLEEEKRQQIARLVSIAREKLKGRVRECMMLLLCGFDNYTEIGKMLGISRDSVRRALEQGASELKSHVANGIDLGGEVNTQADVEQSQGEDIKTMLMPLDTVEEQARLQRFINEQQIVHLALSSGTFREVLVVYH